MELLPKELRDTIPPLYAKEGAGEGLDATAYVKFFTPWGLNTWIATEFDGHDIFFGWAIVGNSVEGELGYFSLSELERVRGQFGLGVERDLYFTPKQLWQAIEDFEREHGWR